MKTPKRVIVPLSVDEVARFWASFRTSPRPGHRRLDAPAGLRSCEVLALDREDLLLSESQIRVRGKGNKSALLPLAPETVQLLDHYLRLERPPQLWRGPVCLPEGARTRNTHDSRGAAFPVPPSSSDHRRRQSQSPPISAYICPDMIRAGISLPALMQLMGHAQIQTTMVYVRITPQDVYQQYVRAVAQLVRPTPPTLP